jgi:hypothetical protein
MLTSPGSVIREQGKDPQTVWAESARDLKTMKDEYINQGFLLKPQKKWCLPAWGANKQGR